MIKKTIFLLVLILLPLPAAACGPTGEILMLGLGLLLAVLAAVAMIQSRAFSAAKEFMRGVTPDRAGPYWLLGGLLVDAGAFALWLAAGLGAVLGAYLALSAVPKLLMVFAGFSREFGAMRAARAHY